MTPAPISMTYRPLLLVIDDDPAMLAMISRILLQQFEVLPAHNGRSGLELAIQRQPDLIMIDVSMPEMDGFEVCRKLKEREETENIPVLFLTAHEDDATEERGLQNGAVDFLRKPVRPAILRMRLNLHLQLKLQCDFLRRLSEVDVLTGAYNRRHLDRTLAAEWNRHRRYDRSLSVVLCDIDHFKAYNDAYGHLDGDNCIRNVAAALFSCLRRSADCLCRYGGEEFVAVVPETSGEDSRRLAERMVAAVHGLAIPHRDSPKGAVTISAGVASLTPDGTSAPRTLLTLADQHLYQAKRSGRNRVSGP